MTQIVIDCCTAIAWLGHDHITKSQKEYASNVLNEAKEGAQFIVPTLFSYELSNVLLQLKKHKVISEVTIGQYLNALNKLPFIFDQSHTLETISVKIALSEQQNLSAYDASYLSIAMSKNIQLATIDKKLKKAAKSLNCLF